MRSHWNSYIQDTIESKIRLNIRICPKHCVFAGKRTFRCGEKLARLRDGFGRRRFAVESVSNCARTVIEVSRWLLVSCCWRCAIELLLCFAIQYLQIAVEWLRKGFLLLRLRARYLYFLQLKVVNRSVVSASVRFRFLVFAIGPVRFMFGFGSCGSWSGSVRFGVWNILYWYLFFFPVSEKQIQITYRKRFIASRKRFHEQRLSKSGESWTRKTKFLEISNINTTSYFLLPKTHHVP